MPSSFRARARTFATSRRPSATGCGPPPGRVVAGLIVVLVACVGALASPSATGDGGDRDDAPPPATRPRPRSSSARCPRPSSSPRTSASRRSRPRTRPGSPASTRSPTRPRSRSPSTLRPAASPGPTRSPSSTPTTGRRGSPLRRWSRRRSARPSWSPTAASSRRSPRAALAQLDPEGSAATAGRQVFVIGAAADARRATRPLEVKGNDPAELAAEIAKLRERLGRRSPTTSWSRAPTQPAYAMPAAAWAARSGDPVLFVEPGLGPGGDGRRRCATTTASRSSCSGPSRRSSAQDAQGDREARPGRPAGRRRRAGRERDRVRALLERRASAGTSTTPATAS